MSICFFCIDIRILCQIMMHVHFYHSDLQLSTNIILFFRFQSLSQEEEEAKKAKKAAKAEAKKQKEVRVGWRWVRGLIPFIRSFA